MKNVKEALAKEMNAIIQECKKEPLNGIPSLEKLVIDKKVFAGRIAIEVPGQMKPDIYFLFDFTKKYENISPEYYVEELQDSANVAKYYFMFKKEAHNC